MLSFYCDDAQNMMDAISEYEKGNKGRAEYYVLSAATLSSEGNTYSVDTAMGHIPQEFELEELAIRQYLEYYEGIETDDCHARRVTIDRLIDSYVVVPYRKLEEVLA